MTIKKDDFQLNIMLICVGFILTVLTHYICVMLGVQLPDINMLEFVAVATSYTCTIMFAMQKRAAYFYGIISTFFLCWFFATQGIFALAIFNGVLVISLIYGYWRWGPDGRPIPVTNIKGFKSFAGYGMFTVIIAGLFLLLVGASSKIDIFLASASATAQLMLDNKKLENWLVWMVINVFSIVFFIQSGFWLLAIQFMLFLLNAIFAYFSWRKGLVNV